MEKRVVPSTGDAHHEPSEDDNLSLQLALPATHYPQDTYVVQVPRDQIYRVPPPENAHIVEKYRKKAAPAAKGKRRRSLTSTLIWVAVVLVVIGALIGIGLLVLYRSYTPKAPVFSVLKLHVKKPKSDQPPKYDITLKVQNPNEKMGITYGSVDGAELIFLTKTIGTGMFPSLHQNSRDLNMVDLKLDTPEDQPAVPRNIEKSMNDKKPTNQISLVLNFNSPLVLNVWIFKLWRRGMDVKCHFRVNTLGEGIKVLSEECKTTMS